MTWTEVRVRGVGDDTRDAIVALLVGAGASGVIEPTATELLTYVGDGADVDALERAVRAAGRDVTVERAPFDDTAWSAPAHARVGVHRVGRIGVAPPWRAAELDDVELPIVIEPAMAFGTGEHETTRGVLHLMQQVVRPGDVVADIGAGSAVLSIAAARLGASRVAAIEVDPDAIGNAEENVARNGVDGRVTVIEGDAALVLPLVAPVRVILANILSSVILELAPVMRDALAPGGRGIVSGILVAERAMVVAALAREGWTLEDEYREGEWWSGVVARP
ncbi:MAG: 50S ribosomal protein L11 methyltransferase [Gemmatimonadaceae bacterium]|nr:50S ribosomal protein L11 methyltransferase [Gemmatimonadaceae bacterium]